MQGLCRTYAATAHHELLTAIVRRCRMSPGYCSVRWLMIQTLKLWHQLIQPCTRSLTVRYEGSAATHAHAVARQPSRTLHRAPLVHSRPLRLSFATAVRRRNILTRSAPHLCRHSFKWKSRGILERDLGVILQLHIDVGRVRQKVGGEGREARYQSACEGFGGATRRASGREVLTKRLQSCHGRN